MSKLLPAACLLLALLPPPLASAQAPPPSARAAGAITGRVVGDDGQPLAGVSVGVVAMKTNGVRSDFKNVETDADGNFRADGLPPAAYMIYVRVPGYLTEDGGGKFYRVGDVANVVLLKGGVITGRVTDAGGDAVVGAQVQAVRVRDAGGRKTRASAGRPFLTDDRGVYRVYGLPPGVYVVVTGGGGRDYGSSISPLQGDVPTYHPSSTRDDAAEITLGNGDEVTGVDIRHRGLRGHAVSGRVISPPAATAPRAEQSPQSPWLAESQLVTLTQAATGSVVGSFSVMQPDKQAFVFYGVPDGEYEAVARQSVPGTDGLASAPRRVTVKGGDVAGIELSLAPLGSVAGTVVVDPRGAGQAACPGARASAVEESLVTLRRDAAGAAVGGDEMPSGIFTGSRSSVGAKGEFFFPGLSPGRHRFALQLPSEDWYVRAVTLAAGRATTDVGRVGLALKSGEKVTGLKVTAAEGAAGLRGKIVAEPNAKLPARLRVHLIPAEREAGDDVLRYAEVATTGGAFSFANIAPGRYWLLTRAEEEGDGRPPRPAAWDGETRARLRREAEAANVAVELKPCERVSDFALRHSRGN